jgi:hypothetical protein
MEIQIISFEKLCHLIKEQRELHDLFNISSSGPNSVTMARDDCHGYDAVLQEFGCRRGISASSFQGLNRELGFLIISKRGVLQGV